MALGPSELVLFSFPTSYLFDIALTIPLVYVIEKVHLDDLDVYLETLEMQVFSDHQH